MTASRSYHLDEQITIQAEAWEEDRKGDDCRYNGYDEGHMGLTSGTVWMNDASTGRSWFTLNELSPGKNAENELVIVYLGYSVRFRISYDPPRPSLSVNVSAGAGDMSPYCDDPQIQLTASANTHASYNGQVSFRYLYNINHSVSTKWVPNPDYCGDEPGCDGSGGGGLAIAAQLYDPDSHGVF